MLMVCADLSAPVDVYADWVDACDAVAKEDGQELGGGGDLPLRAPAAARSGGRGRDEDDDENIDDLIDDDDAGGGYGGDGILADDEEY
jgi:transcription elongation factor Elf1